MNGLRLCLDCAPFRRLISAIFRSQSGAGNWAQGMAVRNWKPIKVSEEIRYMEAFFDRPAPDVAVDLIGAEFTVAGVGGRIVETEAYTHEDPASHSYNGQTPRNRAMFGSPGTVYIYRSYGIHWCLNFVCQAVGAVLIRSLEPAAGLDLMRQRRGVNNPVLLCSGPGRLCQALAVTIDLNGQSLADEPFYLNAAVERPLVSSGRRVGITKAAEVPWRFGVKGSRFLSKKL